MPRHPCGGVGLRVPELSSRWRQILNWAIFRPFQLSGTVGESSNGRTQDSDSCYLGSNPSSPTGPKRLGAQGQSSLKSRSHRLAVRTSASHAGNAGSSPAGVTQVTVRAKATGTAMFRSFLLLGPASTTRTHGGRRGNAVGFGVRKRRGESLTNPRCRVGSRRLALGHVEC